MKIQLFTQNLLKNSYSQRYDTCSMTKCNMSNKPLIKNLNSDTVSFSGASNRLNLTFGYLVEKTYKESLPVYMGMGKKLLDTLEAIANKFKDKGVCLDRKYCEDAITKRTDSFMDKFLRSGAAPNDRIRSTLYVENPYDFKLIKDILNELEQRGYAISTVTKTVNGKKVKTPDFDIRLPDVTQADTKILGPELQKCISKPLNSGYEDIQMRLIDTISGGRDPQPLELIILYGKNYARKAKTPEEYYSYFIRRALEKRLHISGIESPKIHSPAYNIKNSIAIISDMLINQISKPLFFNGKNKDFFHDNFQLPVKLSKDNCKVLSGLVNNIRTKISEHYRAECQKIRSKDYIPQIEKLIKNSPEFKERTDKTIYVADIRAKQKDEIKRINELKQNDLDTMKLVEERMSETIEKYGDKN